MKMDKVLAFILIASAPATLSAKPPTPAIPEDQARQIAMKSADGELLETHYEREAGAWRWSFEFKENGRIHEIGVDATSGKIVEDSWENMDGKD